MVVSGAGDVAMQRLEAKSVGRGDGAALVQADGGLEGQDAVVLCCCLFDGFEMAGRKGLRYGDVIGIGYSVI